MSENIRPLGDRVLVRRAPEESTTAGGLLLPDQAKEKPRRGTVLRLGRGRNVKSPETGFLKAEQRYGSVPVPFQVEPGDTVYFNRYGGIEVPVELGAGLLLISEDEILAYTRG